MAGERHGRGMLCVNPPLACQYRLCSVKVLCRLGMWLKKTMKDLNEDRPRLQYGSYGQITSAPFFWIRHWRRKSLARKLTNYNQNVALGGRGGCGLRGYCHGNVRALSDRLINWVKLTRYSNGSWHVASCTSTGLWQYQMHHAMGPPLTLILLMWRIGWVPNNFPVYIQQNATLHSLFISGNCSTCFGWYFYPSWGAHTTVSTASGICHTVTAIFRCRGRVGTGLSVLWLA
jgi:hypothetical protein